MNVKTRFVLAAVMMAASVLTADAIAQGQSQGRGRAGGQGGGQPEKPVTITAAAVFRDTDRATFQNYFVAHRIAADTLPPGIAKNVARGKPLPPGIAKRAVPADLLALGPKLDKETSLAIVGEVVVALKGGVVIDILAGVFR